MHNHPVHYAHADSNSYSSKYSTEHQNEQLHHSKNLYNEEYNDSNYDDTRSSGLESKYQTTLFAVRPNSPEYKPKKASKEYNYKKEDAHSKSNSTFTDFRRLPIELESVQERSIEQSERTHKGSAFNESARVRGEEEGLKFKMDGEMEREYSERNVLNGSNAYSKGTLKYRTLSTGYGTNSNNDSYIRDGDVPNYKSPPNARYDDRLSEYSRNLTDSLSQKRIHQDTVIHSSERNGTVHNATSGSLGKIPEHGEFSNERAVSSFEPGSNSNFREFSKTMGTLGSYTRDLSIENDRDNRPNQSIVVDSSKQMNERRPQYHHERVKSNNIYEDSAKSDIRENSKSKSSLDYLDEPLVSKRADQTERKIKERDTVKKYDNESSQRFTGVENIHSQISRLEGKLKAKEKLIENMKSYHEDLWIKFQGMQQELYKIKSDQTTKSKDDSERFAQQRENEELKRIEKQNAFEIQELKAENKDLIYDNQMISKKYEAKVEALVIKVKKLELTNKDLHEDYYRQEELLQTRTSLNEAALRRDLQDNEMRSRVLSNENEELHRKNEALTKIVRDKTRQILKVEQRIDETIRDQIDERVNQTLHETSRNYSHKIQKYKEIIKGLKIEIENLNAELKGRPTARQQREIEVKLRNLESELMEERSQARETRRSTEPSSYGKIISELKIELEVDSSADLIPKMRDLTSSEKASTKFISAITDMILKCAPNGYFREKPPLKESWKFIKKVMEEYMVLKRQNRRSETHNEEETQILKTVNSYLAAQNYSEIPSRLKKLISEYDLMDVIISKLKSLMDLHDVTNLAELDRILQHELDRKEAL